MTEALRRKASKDCLSGYQISRFCLSLGTESELSDAQAHVNVCENCRILIRQETEEVMAARYEAVPQCLRDAVGSDERAAGFRWWWTLTPMFGLVLALIVWMKVGDNLKLNGVDEVRSKGGAWVELSVMRDGYLVFDKVPLESVLELQVGDRLRFRFQADLRRWASLEGAEGAVWDKYFFGELPKDGWLPVGVAITDSDSTRLRLSLCRDEASLLASNDDVDGSALQEGCLGTVKVFSLKSPR